MRFVTFLAAIACLHGLQSRLINSPAALVAAQEVPEPEAAPAIPPPVLPPRQINPAPINPAIFNARQMNIEQLFGRPPQPSLRRDTRAHIDYSPINMGAVEPVDPEQVKKWVDQLDDDSFRRRESAAKKLRRAGAGVVPFVIPALESGDLELTHSVIKILHAIALTQSPDDVKGAWSHLQRLAKDGTGSRRTRSAEAVEEIRDYRSGQAEHFLKKAGVFIGPADFIVRAISQQKPIVQIDENWNGDLEALGWLRWLREIEYARVKGPALRPDVMTKLRETADLSTIALVDGAITPDVLAPLAEMSRIHSLEIRYVDLDEGMVQPIVDLPIRVSLSMKGTGIGKASVQAMREALPGLQIDCNEGGFLGVTCQSQFNNCQIQSVLPGSAADEAGLLSQDVVIGIDDDPIQRFEDLQLAIGMHFPGDKVKVTFRRDGKEQVATVKLGKMKER